MTTIKEDKNNIITLTDDEGKEQEFEVLFTFEDSGQNYLLYFDPKDADGEVYAAKYNPADDKGGQLASIDNDEEWKLVEDALEEFQKDDADLEDSETADV